MTDKPNPQDFFHTANVLQDVASRDKPSDTELLAEAGKVIINLQKLLWINGKDPLNLILHDDYIKADDFLEKIDR